jgi:hypothetical protein
MKPLTEEERAAALEATQHGVADADDAELKAALCATHGHPPVVTTFFGYVYCARCGAQIGDRLGGVFDLSKHAVIGHKMEDGSACAECANVIASLTPEQRLLTQVAEEAVA